MTPIAIGITTGAIATLVLTFVFTWVLSRLGFSPLITKREVQRALRKERRTKRRSV